MNEQRMMLRKLSSMGFAVWELHMYLDTHPEDMLAIQKLREYEKKQNELKSAYESKFGPLLSTNVGSDTKWTWLQDPWPWDFEEEGE